MKTHEDNLTPDWMVWNHREQRWMIHVWDPVAPGVSIPRSMHVLLTDEQADVIFAGFKVLSPLATGD